GYGEAFQRKIMGDWGGKGFPDHMAVVDTAIAHGLADPDRLGVWGASHGGVYVPITAHTPPNPYLHLPGQEVETTSGLKLILMNPAYMLRQMQEDFPGEYGARSRITSLKPVNPNNAPDAWEAKVLRGFEQVREERAEVQEIGGKPYIRVLRPFVVVEECLKCHEQQRYHLGEVRGGIGVSIPLEPFTAIERPHKKLLVVSHGGIWLLGLLGMRLWYRREHTLNLLRLKTLHDLRESEQKYHLVADYTSDWEYWVGTAGEIVYMSPSCKERTGYDVAEFIADPGLLAGIVHPDDRAAYQAHWDMHSEQAAEGEVEFRILTRMGETRWINHLCRPVFGRDGAWRGIRAGNRDVTARRQAEAAAGKLNRLYRVLSRTNELIVRRPEPQHLYQAACDIAVSEGGLAVAWIAMMDEDGRIHPLASSGVTLDFLRDFVAQLAGYEGETAVSTALRENRAAVVHNLPETQFMAPWLDKIQANRLGAAASIPIAMKGRKRAAFTLYSHETGFFDQAEVALLEELAKDISHALEVAGIDAEQEKAREQLRLSASVFENSSEGVVMTDAAQRILMVNRAFSELTGYTAEEVLGQTPAMLKSGHHDRDYYAAMWASLHEAGRWQGEIWNRRKNGEAIPEWLSIAAVKDDLGQVTHYVGVFTDISQIKESEARLDYLARHDSLTGLPNRLMLATRIEHALDQARRAGKQLALLLLDFDRFKDINDSFGHAMGDELLQQAAARLSARLRNADTISRLGGDEFTVLL
ncbi:MAG: PAS domain S-box protein, partial [Sulfurimicrobium sp.]